MELLNTTRFKYGLVYGSVIRNSEKEMGHKTGSAKDSFTLCLKLIQNENIKLKLKPCS